jgi:5-methylcytosine-specific restriction protein A
MRRFYFHHVGEAGAQRDFPRTVYSQQSMSVVEESVGEGHPYRGALLLELKRAFPSGRFNCWGVPAGAHSVIKRLAPGDFVLLVRAAKLDGIAPALCEVKVFLPEELSRLSTALWGESKFPYVFFFDTEVVGVPWPRFLHEIGYSLNLRPRGMFCAVDPARLERWRGAAGYAEHLRDTYTSKTEGI